MTPELQNTLAMLAQKLGTSVEHLWPILVAKERLDAFLCLGGGLIFGIAFLVGAAYLAKKAIDDWDEITWLPASLFLVFAVIALIISIASIGDACYPEAAAIHSLIKK